MSAYLVDDCHLTALAAYALRHGLYGSLVDDTDPRIDSLHELGTALKQENVKSLTARYPSQAADTWPVGEPFQACKHGPSRHAPRIGNPMQIVKAAHCYAYQACEHDGWQAEGNPVREMVERIAEHAIRQTDAYQACEWGFPCDHSRKLVSLMDLAKRGSP